MYHRAQSQMLPVVVIVAAAAADVGHTLAKAGSGPAQDAMRQGPGNPSALTLITLEPGRRAAAEAEAEWLLLISQPVQLDVEMDAWLQEFPSALLMRLAALLFLERGRNVLD